MKKRYLHTIFFFFTLFSFVGQNLKFKHLTTTDGLSSNMVHSMIQDSDGFMWFGTEDGLCRYDGYHFVNFFYSSTNQKSLSSNIVLSIVEDKNKQLWIATHKGLNKIDLETYEITRVDSAFINSKLVFTIQSLYVHENTLWIATENSGLHTLDINTNKVTSYVHNVNNNSSLSSNTVNSVLRDPEMGLLVATDIGLDVLDEKTSTFKHVLNNVKVANIHKHTSGDVLLGVFSNESHYLKLNNLLSFEKIKLPFTVLNKLIYPFSDSEQNTWISVRDYGLVYTNAKTKKVQKFLYDKNNLTGINSNTITNIYEDSHGNIWLSSYDAGINVVIKKNKPFTLIKDNHLSNGLLNNRVRAIYQDSKEDIWVGTKVNGSLSRFNRSNLTFEHFKPNSKNKYSLSNDFILAITEYKPGYLWIATLNGLNLFNTQTGKVVKVLKHQKNNRNSLSSNSLYALLQDKENLYIGNVDAGFDVYNVQSNTFTNYKNTGASNQLSDNRVKVIYKDKKNHLLVGTVNGLNLYDETTNTFQQFLNDPQNKNSISENNIISIYEDKQGNLWIGTSLGINLMDIKNQTFKVYTTKDGLPGNSIRGILEDEDGNLWLSTNNGLSKFNTKNKTFKNYNIHDGLQGNEFSSFVSCKTHNGEMLFGGNNGFNIFNPKEIVENKVIPKVLITNFKLFNENVDVNTEESPLNRHIAKTKELILKDNQSVFGFEFVALNYTATENNKYAYKMEGFDKNWNYIGSKREANYTNLDAGDYVFKVKASNNDGVWNETGTSIKIKILPPPWKTWWAYTGYSIVCIALIFMFRQNVVKRNNEKKEREIDAMKIKFFANISHEFRTPLTLILSPLEKLLKVNQDAKQSVYLQLMSRHTKRLLNLVNQLLEFQKLGLGASELNLKAGDIVKFTKEVSCLFVELSNEKNIEFKLVSKIEELYTLFDHDKMEKVISNLLSNAFKFTPENGKIFMEIDLQKNKYFQITVKDSGIGIPSDQLKNIFKRFYQVENLDHVAEQGSGIGLSLVKEYVELHKGKIIVDSKVDVGSSFVFTIPIKEVVKTDIKEITEETSFINRIQEENKLEAINQNNKAPLILLVEDHKDLREFLKTSLIDYYRVIEASNGVEGVEMAITHIPDLIISDVMMPKMDGNALCSKIKTDKRTSHIPVMLLTAQTSEEFEVNGFNNGADHYVTKPFSFEVLKSRINNLLDQRKKLQSLFSKKLEVQPSEIAVTTIDEKLIQKALDLIEKNIENPNYSVDELSKGLEISRGHLYRKINAITGKSPSEFIRSIRLKRAAQLLKLESLTISEIAYKVGFTNPKYFSKCFKAEFNVLPSKFIESYKEGSFTED